VRSAGAPRAAARGRAAIALWLAALGAALYLDVTASSDARGLRRTCAPNCNQADVDDVQSKYTLAGITAGIGGALVVTGVVLFILHGKGSARAGALGPSTALLRF
jgi:hypothetical protein